MGSGYGESTEHSMASYIAFVQALEDTQRLDVPLVWVTSNTLESGWYSEKLMRGLIMLMDIILNNNTYFFPLSKEYRNELIEEIRQWNAAFAANDKNSAAKRLDR